MTWRHVQVDGYWVWVAVHAGLAPQVSDPYDCNAGLSNFHSGWSPGKKEWCCNQKGMGCEGATPPAFPAAAGMVWKKEKVNGFWTWVMVRKNTAHPDSLPYDCNAGLANADTGWSEGKKHWCCTNEHKGCI